MKDIQYPVKFNFKISTLSNDFTAKDANGQTVAFVKQKLFKLKEAINIFTDESKGTLSHTIAADRWIDFSAAYSLKYNSGEELGKIARKGWRSIWKAEYEIIDQHEKLQYHIREDNGWVKVLDSLFSEIPLIGMFTGYFFNPSYSVTNLNGDVIVQLKKEPSFWGRKFVLNKLGIMDKDNAERIMLSLMMMVLLERRRG